MRIGLTTHLIGRKPTRAREMSVEAFVCCDTSIIGNLRSKRGRNWKENELYPLDLPLDDQNGTCSGHWQMQRSNDRIVCPTLSPFPLSSSSLLRVISNPRRRSLFD